MARVKNEYYILQPMPDGKTVKMTKFVDDEPKTDSIYEVGQSSCQCWQAQRQCRHMKMWIKWNQLGRGRMRVDYEQGHYVQLEEESLI